MAAFWPSLRRELRLLRRRPWDSAMLTWVPALAVALLCATFSAGLPRGLPIAVWNEDAGALARQLQRMLQASPGLRLAEPVHSAVQAQQALQAMQVYAVLHIPRHTQQHIQQGQGAALTLLHNAQLGTHSGLIERDVRQVVGTLSAGLEMQASAKRGTPAQALPIWREPLTLELRPLFNPSGNYEAFLALALIPALLHVLAMTAGAWTVGRELRDRSLGDWLLPAPPAVPSAPAAPAAPTVAVAAGPGLPRWWAIACALAGKLAPAWLSLSLVGMAGMLYLTQWRGWQAAGSLALVLLALASLVAASLVIGGLLAAATRSLRTALSLSGLLAAPAFAFSGVGFPLLAMSAGAHAWATAMPYTHYIRLQIEQLQMGADIAQSLPVVSGLWLACLLGLILGALALRWALPRPALWGGR
ncbi:ABC transporter permease [Vandammella animalimorsus]|uniref:ABC transporter n=1 Tax=Vandammella animalimorsus TaxID=2029117 RepID=A0A2A2AFJ1_9BURK|nr:ABC transporter permease [Vandammella animalimorsus]PAT36543.1 ABC transporter [Vandammella animalimorsus]